LKPSARHTIGIDLSPSCEEKLLTASVIVCTRNRPVSLRSCLEGLARLDHPPDEVIVVDNTPGDDETKTVAEDFGARYLIEAKPGLSRARNCGMAASRSEVVVYLDDDAIPDVQWLGRLLEPFNDPQVGLVTGRIVRSGAQQIDRPNQPARTLSKKDPEWFEIATFGGLGLGSNMAFRKSVGDSGAIFDERLGRGAPFEIAEENYAFALVLSKGDTAVFLPDAIVFHPPGKPSDIKQEARNLIAFSMLLLAEFPDRRSDLIKFLYRRIRRKPLTWPRDSPDPGEIITSGWSILFSASFSAAILFFKTPKPLRQ
jgi:glycosyltransferase involved in cell wall biosynthesis